MSKISIFNFTINAPAKFKAGDVLDEFGAKVFNYMWRKNALKVLKKYADQHPGVTAEELEKQLQNVPLAFSVSVMEIESEAINIAYNIIVDKLKNEGLPTPPQIFVHARELAAASKAIQEKARRVVIARYKVVNNILSKFSES